ncbi:phosphoribosylanthranilate isomerase [Pokkaliibacter sp. MBI-7]|uniref:phosphoribosylanthranilate isomerase n=1 Tax=Pokkaliibacter sp. MBI-7 TaxID=3040600 RepID=UPI002448B5F2|nr:phosphoribosylanthranilate isomerase [Pokkaliibacter sp. MBI-7]MDH2435093.1 phosphoribosylanthranilate isomerase [Pokkaliibacter sp. MBI-7]
MTRTRVKICGMRSVEDALAAVEAGADALGFVFYPPSKRAIDAALCRDICQALPPFVERVGLFVDEAPEQVKKVLSIAPLSLLQFHGDETAAYCESFSVPYIKAIRMKPGTDLIALAQTYSSAQALLVDAYMPGMPGGTGLTFDWQVLPDNVGKPVILAGGLTPDNIGIAVRGVRPYAVDVSGGVESAPGKKDAALISQFVQGVLRGDAS